MKNRELVLIVNAYNVLHQISEGIKLPAKIAWTRRVNMDKLFHAKGIIDGAIKEIRDKYFDEDHSEEFETEDGKKDRRVKKEYEKDFRAEQEEIMDQETDLEIRKVKLEELGDVNLSDLEMDTIAFMLEGGD